ncbi:MAG TPA: hypothetical protein VHA56_03130 [Mucilaginibacter sp.]|nr:hypothetical protein [Mucilaginibacter sp.]
MGLIITNPRVYTAQEIQHQIDVAIQERLAADGVDQAAATAAAVAVAKSDAVDAYLAAHPEQEPGIYNASAKDVDLRLPDGSVVLLAAGDFYSAAALLEGQAIDVLAKGHYAFSTVVYAIDLHSFSGDAGTNVTVDDGDVIISYAYADLSANDVFVITDYPDTSAVVQSVIESNPKRFYSFQNFTANDHKLRVVRADDETYVEYVIPAGKQFIYFADTAGLPDAGNEHYLRLVVGEGDVTCEVGTEAHAAAGDNVVSVDFDSGFVTDNFAETVGLWASSGFMVIRDRAATNYGNCFVLVNGTGTVLHARVYGNDDVQKDDRSCIAGGSLIIALSDLTGGDYFAVGGQYGRGYDCLLMSNLKYVGAGDAVVENSAVSCNNVDVFATPLLAATARDVIDGKVCVLYVTGGAGLH